MTEKTPRNDIINKKCKLVISNYIFNLVLEKINIYRFYGDLRNTY
jgi:hypothetical protein